VAHPARFDLGAQTLTRDEERVIADRLRAGDLVIYPTDTLYAIGCRALDGAAVSRLRGAKGGEGNKPLPVIVADVAQARSMASRWPAQARLLADAFWPGPLTLVVPAAPGLPPELLAGARGVAIRVPGLSGARLLARLAGPLVSTSANLAGALPCLTVDLAMAAFPLASLVFDIGPLDGAPSTLVDVAGPDGSARLLREGRVPRAFVDRVLGGAAATR
jgi:L-threonylcarbamoyladenylate synthase